MPHHVTLLAAGTRGDIQPFVALGRGLREAGYDVTLAAGAELRALVEGHAVPFSPLRGPTVRRMLDDSWAAAQDTDAVVYHPKTMAGPHLAERLGVPVFVAGGVPVLSPTRAFPLPGLVKRRTLGGTLNRLSYRLSRLATPPCQATIDAWRAETLDLPPATSPPDPPKLYAYSEAVVPRPADWGGDTIVTGYWDLPPAPGWTPDPLLERFLAADAPPVYVGFGSMPLDDAARTSREVVAALRVVGVRGLLGAPLTASGGDMLAVADVPHHWLFEHVAAVVHHGGAGTTGAGLRAGRPTVIVPYAVDQPFWAHAVHARGAGPRPIPARRLGVRRLALALSDALEDPIAGRAGDLGRALRREDGVAVAIQSLSTAIQQSHRRSLHVHAV